MAVQAFCRSFGRKHRLSMLGHQSSRFEDVGDVQCFQIVNEQKVGVISWSDSAFCRQTVALRGVQCGHLDGQKRVEAGLNGEPHVMVDAAFKP
ncbi:hypothetical protein LR69_04313 [Geobacillus sp. BCO2]|nr:hypothetical protein LR69_04313 [Geobacillus sp. BCO2]